MNICTPFEFNAYRDHLVPWTWNYRKFWAAMWVIGTKPRFSERTTISLRLIFIVVLELNAAFYIL